MAGLLAQRWVLLLSSAVLLCSVACKPEIGDECQLSTDCSASGDRLCDTTQPDGYCTIFNCEPGSCPEESICVGFNRAPSASPECADTLGSSRLFRSFCMFRCDDNDDCRDGYVCMDMGHEGRDKLGAIVIERPPFNGKVCTVRPRSESAGSADALPESNVCEGASGGGGQSGAGGQAGAPATGGSAGAGGMSGSAGSSGAAGSTGSSGAGGA